MTMDSLLKKIKSFAAGVLVIAVLTGTAVSSCTSPQKQMDETEQTEGIDATESSENPSDGGSEHPTDDNSEMDADTTATSDEHPSGDEGSEHPSN